MKSIIARFVSFFLVCVFLGACAGMPVNSPLGPQMTDVDPNHKVYQRLYVLNINGVQHQLDKVDSEMWLFWDAVQNKHFCSPNPELFDEIEQKDAYYEALYSKAAAYLDSLEWPAQYNKLFAYSNAKPDTVFVGDLSVQSFCEDSQVIIEYTFGFNNAFQNGYSISIKDGREISTVTIVAPAGEYGSDQVSFDFLTEEIFGPIKELFKGSLSDISVPVLPEFVSSAINMGSQEQTLQSLNSFVESKQVSMPIAHLNLYPNNLNSFETQSELQRMTAFIVAMRARYLGRSPVTAFIFARLDNNTLLTGSFDMTGGQLSGGGLMLWGVGGMSISQEPLSAHGNISQLNTQMLVADAYLK